MHKCRKALLFHQLREAIAAKIIFFNYLLVTINPPDIISKHWNHQQVKTVLRTTLFYVRDTVDLFKKQSDNNKQTKKGCEVIYVKMKM